MLKHGSIFIVLLCFLELGTGLYFHIGETERKCFIEEIPDDTTVLGKISCDIIFILFDYHCQLLLSML